MTAFWSDSTWGGEILLNYLRQELNYVLRKKRNILNEYFFFSDVALRCKILLAHQLHCIFRSDNQLRIKYFRVALELGNNTFQIACT
jgi:hypothetical protein